MSDRNLKSVKSEKVNAETEPHSAQRKNQNLEKGEYLFTPYTGMKPRIEIHPGYDESRDSTPREIFKSGAERDTQTGKGFFYLLPGDAMQRVALVFEKGAKRYGARNWEKGIPIERYMDSALRHSFQYLLGKDDEDHLGQACWNLICALATEERVKNHQLDPTLLLPSRLF